MKRYQVVLAVLAIVAAIGIVGNMDYKDEIRQQIAYCENVKAGVWPDYDGTYKTECPPDKLKEFQNILR